MKHIFEEEFRLQNPQWDFDNNILGPYTRWLEYELLEARKQLATHDFVGRSEQLTCECVGLGSTECNKINDKWICCKCNRPLAG